MSQRSSPRWALGIMSAVTIITQVATMYDPSGFMKDFDVPSENGVRMIAFLLVLINGYDLIAALQDNWTVYRFSCVARVAAATLFWSFGPAWRMLVGVEVGTLAILAGAMWFA